jgi:hypothetical protein
MTRRKVRSRALLRLLIGAVIGLLLGQAAVSATAAHASAYGYDLPATTRKIALPSTVTDSAGRHLAANLAGQVESVQRVVVASTTPLHKLVAANSGSSPSQMNSEFQRGHTLKSPYNGSIRPGVLH